MLYMIGYCHSLTVDVNIGELGSLPVSNTVCSFSVPNSEALKNHPYVVGRIVPSAMRTSLSIHGQLRKPCKHHLLHVSISSDISASSLR